MQHGGLLASVIVISAAACSSEDGPVLAVDQSQATECWAFDRVNQAGARHDQGQSFKAPMSGQIVRIDLGLQSSRGSHVALAVYDGDGFAGAMLAEETVVPAVETNPAVVPPIQQYPLLRAIPVTTEHVYSIGVAYVEEDGEASFCGVFDDVYADGHAWNTNIPVDDIDLQFRVYVTAE